MAVAAVLREEDDIPSGFASSGSCSLNGRCETLRRTTYLSARLAQEFNHRAPELLLAATLLLARRYSDSTEFRIGVRRASWSAHDGVASLVSSMPSVLTGEAHLRATAAGLARVTPPPATADTMRPSLICVVDGPGDGCHEAGLVVSCEMTPDGTALHVDCHARLDDTAFADRMLGHLANLLLQLTEQPERTVGELNLLTEAERQRLRWLNDTARPYPSDASIYALFAEHAASRPDQVAVTHAEDSLTYRELEEQALRLAAALHEKGVRPHDRVAFALERTPRLLVAVLAILRVGAAYVPIATDLPANRRDFLLADSGATLLLAEGPAVTAAVPVMDLNHLYEAPLGEPLPVETSLPSDAAYVMYTSGTTGRPKGVLVSQRAVVRLVRNTDYVTLSPDTRILQTGAIAFDATTFEFWGALLNGGTVVLVPETVVLNAAELDTAIAQHQVNTLFLTTALFHQIVEQDPAALVGCQVLIGGETLSARHIGKAMDACPDSVFIHVYGPTENTTFSVAHRITRHYARTVPIGRPIANSTAYVLDRDGHAQPFGISGELYVGGGGLSDGYLGQPDLNDSAFVLGGPDAPERLYRTGDIARWTDDGELEFIGRADYQVKIRGYRVELGEVEAQLSRLPSVREAVILLRHRAGGLSTLSAYFTAGTALKGKDLRDALLKELPEYMVPSAFTQVDMMPLTHNQKIDRAALAAIEPTEDSGLAAPGQAPRTDLEAAVADAFAKVLGLPSVSVDDDFFALGGHSLLATRLWSQLRSTLGLEFGLRLILDTPTVAGLASSLEQHTASAVARPRLVRRPS